MCYFISKIVKLRKESKSLDKYTNIETVEPKLNV